MIKIEFPIAIAIFISVPLILVFLSWIFYNLKREKKRSNELEYFQQCPYCTYVFFDYSEKALKTCPHCQSLIAKNTT